MTALEQNREDQALGFAWRRCEAAKPKGWHVRLQGGAFASDTGFSTAEAWAPMGDDVEQGQGDTPTEALTALAEALEGRKAL